MKGCGLASYGKIYKPSFPIDYKSSVLKKQSYEKQASSDTKMRNHWLNSGGMGK